MTMLTRKTKAASLAMVAIAAFSIAAPQVRAELPDGYEQLMYVETTDGGGQCIATGIRPDLAHKIELRVRVLKSDAQQVMWVGVGSAGGYYESSMGSDPMEDASSCLTSSRRTLSSVTFRRLACKQSVNDFNNLKLP